jgi:acyl-CoA thioesterase FadM
MSIRHSFIYTVPPETLDPEYRHLHHAESLKLLERGRLDLLVAVGCPSQELMKEDIYLVISSLSVRYLREVMAGEVTVECVDVSISGREIIIPQRLLNSKGKVALEAEVRSVCMSGSRRRGMPVPERLVAALV